MWLYQPVYTFACAEWGHSGRGACTLQSLFCRYNAYQIIVRVPNPLPQEWSVHQWSERKEEWWQIFSVLSLARYINERNSLQRYISYIFFNYSKTLKVLQSVMIVEQLRLDISPVALRDPVRLTPKARPMRKNKVKPHANFHSLSHLSTLTSLRTMKPRRRPVMVPPRWAMTL